VRFAQLLAAQRCRRAPADTRPNSADGAAGDAARSLDGSDAYLLTERPDLRSKLIPLQWSQLLARSGEIEDVPYKIALAELCAEQRLEGVSRRARSSRSARSPIPTTRAPSAGSANCCTARTHDQPDQRAAAHRRPAGRTARVVLLAIGATNTDSALDALLRMDMAGKNTAVEAALKEHRSPKAQEVRRHEEVSAVAGAGHFSRRSITRSA
jgi:hypothetical protein